MTETIGAPGPGGYACGWDVIHACNYRCPYCFFIPSWAQAPEENNRRHLACSRADWLGFWERMHSKYGRFQVEIAGGEPFLYPDFIPMISEIGRQHDVRIVTNLSVEVEDFLGRFDPRGVAFAASFHPHHASQEVFRRKLRCLREAGFSTMASVVAYPEFFGDLSGILEAFRADGIEVYLNPYQGIFRDRAYPQAYTREQKAWLHGYSPSPSREFLMRTASPRGRRCAAGQRYFRLWPDGTAYRCCPATEIGERPLGHIKAPDFSLRPESAPCPAEKCSAPNEIVHLIEG